MKERLIKVNEGYADLPVGNTLRLTILDILHFISVIFHIGIPKSQQWRPKAWQFTI